MTTLRPSMPFGPQKRIQPTTKPKEQFDNVVIQVGDGRNITDEEQDEKVLRGISKLRETYTRQQEEIGAPAGEGGYDADMAVTTASKEKIDQKRREAGSIPAIQPEGSTVGLKTPGLSWAAEDAVDRGDHDMHGRHTEQDRIARGLPANPDFNPYGL